MLKHSNPQRVHPPLGAYTHCVSVPANARWLSIAGQVGIDSMGRVRAGVEKQAEQVFKNILACLRDNAMNKMDLVKLTVFLVDPRHIEIYRAARRAVLGDDALPTSTLLVVDGLASPDLLIEVEAWAAKAQG